MIVEGKIDEPRMRMREERLEIRGDTEIVVLESEKRVV